MHRDYPHKIIFDMDGVITSEECYWDAAALVVWELLFSRRGLGLAVPPSLPSFEPAPSASRIAAIRRVVFQDDRVITMFKRQSVNSNWDLAFYTFAFQLIRLLNKHSSVLSEEKTVLFDGNNLQVDRLPRLGCLVASRRGSPTGQPPFAAILGGWDQRDSGAEPGARLHALLQGERLAAAFPVSWFTPPSPLWEEVRCIFQEWYLGSTGYAKVYGRPPKISGKPGLLAKEQLLLPPDRLKDTLKKLRRRGWILGIATGRPRFELFPLLNKTDLLLYFNQDSIVTFDRVEEAQRAPAASGRKLSLGKPHPFSLLAAYWGTAYPQEKYFAPPYPALPSGKCWLVGDAPADLLAARAADVSFIAVLTGQGKTAGYSFFTEQGAGAVLPDITHLPSFLEASACF